MRVIEIDNLEYCTLASTFHHYGKKYFDENWDKLKSYQNAYMRIIVRNEIMRQFLMRNINGFILGTGALHKIDRLTWNFESDDITQRKSNTDYFISFTEGAILPKQESKTPTSPGNFGEVIIPKNEINKILSLDEGFLFKEISLLMNEDKMLTFYLSKDRWTLNECISIISGGFNSCIKFTMNNTGLYDFLEDRIFGYYMEESDRIVPPIEILQYVCDLGYEFPNNLHYQLQKRNKLPTPSSDSFSSRFYEEWLLKDSWTLDEGSQIISNLDPHDEYCMFSSEFFPERLTKVNKVNDLALRSIKAGKLETCHGGNNSPYFINSIIFLNWSIDKGLVSDSVLLNLFHKKLFKGKNTRFKKKEVSDIAVRHLQSSDQTNSKDIRLISYPEAKNVQPQTKVIIDVINEFLKQNKPIPDADTALTYIKDNKEKFACIVDACISKGLTFKRAGFYNESENKYFNQTRRAFIKALNRYTKGY